MRLHSNRYLEALIYIGVTVGVQLALSPRLTRRLYRQGKAMLVRDENAGYIVREIESKVKYGYFYVEDVKEFAHRRLLQRAIAVHIAEKLQLSARNIVYELLDKPLEDLQQLEETKQLQDSEQESCSDDSTDYDSDEEIRGPLPSREELLRLRVAALPMNKEWVELESGLYFQRIVHGAVADGEDENGDEGEPSETSPARSGDGCKAVTMIFRFKSKRPDASQAIDRFVQTAFLRFQLAELKKIAVDTARYMYVQSYARRSVPSSPDAEDSNSGGRRRHDRSNSERDAVRLRYKRYALSEDKTFSTLFFPDKPHVLRLLDQFTHKTGKFAIKGFPYKLGFLLHGPPGTGKTSLIKAVAQHTKRHIVSVSLAKIRTNQDLRNALFDHEFTIEGKSLPVHLGPSDVVYVLEDIDCACTVVQARDDGHASRDKKSSKKLSKPAIADKLNLSGLLNVLDGVIDTPGRIVIMTTNHPEKLDRALIRPGRVNKKLELGYMAPDEMQAMLEYYFAQPLTATQRDNLALLSDPGHAQITPAQVEEVCAEHMEVNDAITALQRMKIDTQHS